MSKDERYKAAKMIILDSSTERFSEIFTVIPKSVVATDLGKNTGRTYVFFDSPEDLTFKDIYRLAQLIEVNKSIILDLIEKQYLSNLKEEEKKGKKIQTK
jgi:hypothetical protein